VGGRLRDLALLSDWTALTVVAKVIGGTAISTHSAVEEADEGIDAGVAAGLQGGRTFAHATGTSASERTSVVADPTVAVVCVFIDASPVA
jgi:hypothetical protein